MTDRPAVYVGCASSSLEISPHVPAVIRAHEYWKRQKRVWGRRHYQETLYDKALRLSRLNIHAHISSIS